MSEARHPASREEFIEMLDELRSQGALDAADEAALIRHYDEVLQELRMEKAELEPEYRRRCREESEELAGEWLAGAAEALGRKQGERMRRLLESVPAVSAGGS